MDDENRPWRACVSEKWAKDTNNEHLSFKVTDAEHSILDLEIPDDMFDEESQAYLADDEDEHR